MTPCILITGARGFLGRNLLHAAAKELSRTSFILLARSEKAAEDLRGKLTWLEPERLRIVQGDITKPGIGLSDSDTSLLASANEVWHLAASTSFDDREGDSIYQGNVLGTTYTIDVARAMPKLERFVYSSTAYVAGNNPGPISEDEMPARMTFRNTYESTKWEAENAVRQSGLPFVIFRPSIIMGHSRTFDAQGERRMIYGYMLGIYYSVLRECKRRRIDFHRCWREGTKIELNMRLIGHERVTKNFVCIDDVVTSMLKILQVSPLLKGYHLTSDRPIDGMALYRSIAKALRIEGVKFVEGMPQELTALERNVLSYTSPFVPYTTNPDPIWLRTNTDKLLGSHRHPMTEKILSGLLERFMFEEVSARHARAEGTVTFPPDGRMLAGA